MILRHSILMYNMFEGHFDPLRLSKIGMAHPVEDGEVERQTEAN